MYYCTYKCPLGYIYLVSDGENLCGCYLEGQKYFATNMNKYLFKEELTIFVNAKKWLERYFNGENTIVEKIPLKFNGTEFRNEVWKVLETISYGETVTYKEISEIIAYNKGVKNISSQAVGGAVGKNPLLIFIPCHRVIGSDGNLTGYAAGLENKKFLLNLESDNNSY